MGIVYLMLEVSVPVGSPYKESKIVTLCMFRCNTSWLRIENNYSLSRRLCRLEFYVGFFVGEYNQMFSTSFSSWRASKCLVMGLQGLI